MRNLQMKKINGDLIKFAKDGTFDVIVHGCNCFNTMGAGIALQIKQNFPEAWEVDRHTIKGYKNKLGHYTKYTYYNYPNKLTVVNAYTQFKPGSNPLGENYTFIRSCFRKIAEAFPDKKIGIPAIGSGLAGGDFNTIWDIIEEETKDLDITMVIYG